MMMVRILFDLCKLTCHSLFSFPNVMVSAQSRYMKCLWKDVKVGDVLHLSCDELIPADILVLRSSDEHGICYIDTQNLDGEANLKQREVPRGFVEKVRHLRDSINQS